MSSLKVISDRCTDNALTVTVRIPPRRNGDANVACLTRIVSDLHTVNPDAYDPPEVPAPVLAHNDGHTSDGGGVIPADIAAAMLRDGVIEFSPEEPPLRACPTGGCGLD